jgi:hypothetical protein
MSFDLPPHLRLAADRLLEGVSRKDMASRAGAISARYRAGGGSAAVVASQATPWPMSSPACPPPTPPMRTPSPRSPSAPPVSSPKACSTPARVPAAPAGRPWRSGRASPARPCSIPTAPSLISPKPCPATPRPPCVTPSGCAPTSSPPATGPPPIWSSPATPWPRSPPAAQAGVVARLWDAAQGVLALIEPGTPAGYQRILAARSQLIEAGAQILAPLPPSCALSAGRSRLVPLQPAPGPLPRPSPGQGRRDPLRGREVHLPGRRPPRRRRHRPDTPGPGPAPRRQTRHTPQALHPVRRPRTALRAQARQGRLRRRRRLDWAISSPNPDRKVSKRARARHKGAKPIRISGERISRMSQGGHYAQEP